jgi:hypothetical protein
MSGKRIKPDESESVSEADLLRLLEVCRCWILRYGPLCPESMMQVDSVREALPELGATVCGIVGYADIEEDE